MPEGGQRAPSRGKNQRAPSRGNDQQASSRWRPIRLRLARVVAVLAVLLAVPASGLAASEVPPAPFSERELIDGFVKTVFGEESPTAQTRRASRLIKKFTGPVDYTIVSAASKDRSKTLHRFLGSLSEAVAGLTLRESRTFDEAQMVIFLVDRADYKAVIRNTAWNGVDTAFLEENACSAVLAARPSGIEQANIYLVVDESFESLSHCMVEEIAQSLGPANDSTDLADSIFNDQSELDVFGIFDWFILSMLYHPAVQPGMSEAEVRPILPAVIADVSRRLPEILESGAGALSHHSAASR